MASAASAIDNSHSQALVVGLFGLYFFVQGDEKTGVFGLLEGFAEVAGLVLCAIRKLVFGRALVKQCGDCSPEHGSYLADGTDTLGCHLRQSVGLLCNMNWRTLGEIGMRRSW
jgi:hypothetical protein